MSKGWLGNVRALLALGVSALVLVGPAGETGARWTTESPIVTTGAVRSGTATLTVTTPYVIQLRSAQPDGTRTYASSTTCPLTTGVVECRDVTATLADERLVPGDVLHITGATTLTTAGNTLRGTLRLSLASLVDRSTPLGSATTTTVIVSGPTATVSSAAARSTAPSDLTWPIGPTSGAGRYAVSVDLTVPSNDAGAAWGDGLRGQTLGLSGLTFTFTQTQT